MKNIRVTIDDNIYLDILRPLFDNKVYGVQVYNVVHIPFTDIMGYTTWNPVIYPVRDRLRITLKRII